MRNLTKSDAEFIKRKIAEGKTVIIEWCIPYEKGHLVEQVERVLLNALFTKKEIWFVQE